MATEEQPDEALPDEIMTEVVQLEEIVREDEDFERRVLAILEHRLNRAATDETFGEVLSAFSDYLDEPGRAFVALLIANLDEANFQRVADSAPKVSSVRTT